jgi:hypothetical protein
LHQVVQPARLTAEAFAPRIPRVERRLSPSTAAAASWIS